MSANRNAENQRRSRRFADTSGFTLIEVLVAFTVMATLLSVLFRGVVMIRAGSISFDDHGHRAMVARAVLDDALAKRDLAAGTYSGVREGFHWTLIAKMIDLSGQLPPPQRDDIDQKTAVGPTQPPDVPNLGMAQAANPVMRGKGHEPHWVPQRLTVRVAVTGQPLKIETIRLVKEAP